jgi:hypothetical protein
MDSQETAESSLMLRVASGGVLARVRITHRAAPAGRMLGIEERLRWYFAMVTSKALDCGPCSPTKATLL